MFEGMLRRQGSVMAEPRMKKLLDFAMLFTINESGKCSFDGYSVFNNVQFGSYAGRRPCDGAFRPCAATTASVSLKQCCLASLKSLWGKHTAALSAST